MKRRTEYKNKDIRFKLKRLHTTEGEKNEEKKERKKCKERNRENKRRVVSHG